MTLHRQTTGFAVARAARAARSRRLRFTGFGLVVCAFGILIWSRLLLVTKPPRVAMAEPPVAQGPTAAGPHAGEGGSAPSQMTPAQDSQIP
jgi:hypothetical protein